MANLHLSDDDLVDFKALAKFAVSILFPETSLEEEEDFFKRIAEMFGGYHSGSIYNQIYHLKDGQKATISRKSYNSFCTKYDEAIIKITLPDHKKNLPKFRIIYFKWKTRLQKRFDKKLLKVNLESEKTKESDKSKNGRPLVYRLTGHFSTSHKDTLISEIEDFIIKYYRAVENLEFNQAWDMLSTTGKYSFNWDGNYDQFKSYYLYDVKDFWFAEVYEIIQLGKNIFECQSGYIFKRSFAYSELDLLKSLSIKDKHQLLEIVDLLVDKLKKHGGKEILGFPLSGLFEKDALYSIWTVAGLKQVLVSDVFKATTEKQFSKIDLCVCQKIEGKWLISNIRDTFYGEKESVYTDWQII